MRRSLLSQPLGSGAGAPFHARLAVLPLLPVALEPMTRLGSERLGSGHRIRTSREYARVRAGARAVRGPFFLALVLATPGEATRFGFIASKRSVGGAVQRNRARRRLRETLRRRWPRIAREGVWMVFIAHRGVLAAPQPALAVEIDRVLGEAELLREESAS